MFEKIRTSLSRQDSFLRNVAVLSSASVVAQVINVLSIPLISRLYSPSDFGTLALFSSVVGLLSTVSGFRYYLVIPLARTDRYLHSFVWISLIFQCLCVFLFLFLVEFASKFLEDTSYAVLIPYRFFIIIGVFCVGVYGLLTQWAIRTKSFSLIAQTKLTQTISRAAAILFLGLLGLKPLGLLVGNIFGQSFGSTSLLRALLNGSNKIKFSVTHIKRAALSYRKMFIYETPSALLNMSGSYLLPIVMAYFFLPEVVGSFSMSQQVLALPSALIGTAIGQVFIQRASEAKNNGNINDVMLKTMLMLIRTGVFPILAIGLLAPSLFVPVLGAKWLEAGKITQILSPWVALNFVYSPLSMIFIIMMLQKPAFLFVITYTALRFLSLCLGRQDPIIAVTILSAVGSVSMIFGVAIPAYLININMKMMLYKVIKAFSEIFLELLPIIFVVVYFNNSVSLLFSIISCLCGGVIYIYFLVKQLT